MDLMDRVFWGMAGFIGIHFLLLSGLEKVIDFYLGSAVAFVFLIWFAGWGYKLLSRDEGE